MVTPDVIAGLAQMVTGTLNKVLLAVTALSLFVGGIVMNLMLLSVIERRHEIGLRRAVGGRRRDVREQFLFESLVLTVSGGVIGLMAGRYSRCRPRKLAGNAAIGTAVEWGRVKPFVVKNRASL